MVLFGMHYTESLKGHLGDPTFSLTIEVTPFIGTIRAGIRF
jgi:hypothetical protein